MPCSLGRHTTARLACDVARETIDRQNAFNIGRVHRIRAPVGQRFRDHCRDIQKAYSAREERLHGHLVRSIHDRRGETARTQAILRDTEARKALNIGLFER
jgi:hypothetical protein